jgi:uncharacterized protein YwgA
MKTEIRFSKYFNKYGPVFRLSALQLPENGNPGKVIDIIESGGGKIEAAKRFLSSYANDVMDGSDFYGEITISNIHDNVDLGRAKKLSTKARKIMDSLT